ILVGVVEDDGRPVPDRLDRRAQFLDQRVEAGRIALRVGGVAGGVVRVGLAQRPGDLRHHRPCVGGIEPDVKIVFAVAMIVMSMVILMGMAVVIVPVMIVPFAGGFAVVMVMVVAMIVVVRLERAALALGEP